jgi:CRISPR system Cascade subunit CasE
MYLSRVEIDTKNQIKMRDLTHLGAYHNWVEQSFPQEITKHIRTRKLWRIDTFHGKRYLLLVSNDQPDLEKLSYYGVPGTASSTNYDKLLNNLSNGMIARFKLVVTPMFAKSTGKQSGKRGQMMQCLNVTDQLSYLEKRASNHGFALLDNDYMVTSQEVKRLIKNHHTTMLRQVCYEGHLKITDIKQFKVMLCKGLGHNKAYGCGLMTIILE